MYAALLPRTLNGFIVIVIILCAIGWAGAHYYDYYQSRQVRRAFRRDKRER
jgi:hypothetical protein